MAELNLDRIVPVEDVQGGSQVAYTYELYTRRGTRILWGQSPHAKDAQEPAAEEKIARLREYAAAHGSLEGAAGRQLIDLRAVEGLQVLDAVIAGSEREEPGANVGRNAAWAEGPGVAGRPRRGCRDRLRAADQTGLARLFRSVLADLLPHDRQMVGRLDADANRARGDADHRDGNLVADQDSLTDFA